MFDKTDGLYFFSVNKKGKFKTFSLRFFLTIYFTNSFYYVVYRVDYIVVFYFEKNFVI